MPKTSSNPKASPTLTPSISPSGLTNSVTNSVLKFLNKRSLRIDAVTNELRANGLVNFGSGSFATVYGHPDLDFVVKVGGFSEEFKFYDRWPEYARLVMAQFSNNPYAPKITALREWKSQKFYVATIEKLEQTVQDIGEDHEVYWQTQHLLERWGGSIAYEFEEKYPALYDLLVGIKSLNRPMDLHSENAMLRKDGSLVITDPIY